MTQVLYKIKKVRNELRFIRPDGKYYYWDFSIPNHDSCWFNLKGELMFRAPKGYMASVEYAYNHPNTDETLKATLLLFCKIIGCKGVGYNANYDNSLMSCHALNQIQQIVSIYESLVNLGITFRYIKPKLEVLFLYNKLGHKKFMREFVTYLKTASNYRSNLDDFTHNYIIKEKEAAFNNFSEEEQEVLKQVSGYSYTSTDEQIPLNDVKTMRTVLNWWKQFNDNVLLMATLDAPKNNYHSVLVYFRNLIKEPLTYAEECGYQLRTNGDLVKEIAAIKEVYKVYREDKDKKTLESINLEQWKFEDDNFTVVLPKSSYDLIQCGNDLHNCVARYGYWEKMLNGDCFIVFIRRKDNPQKNYVCCEIVDSYNGDWYIKQFLTTNNNRPYGEDIDAFRLKFEDFVHSHK